MFSWKYCFKNWYPTGIWYAGLEFFHKALRQFGFNNTLCSWILEIVNLDKLSVLVNWKSVYFFNCTCGVRRGDPVSPLIFYIIEEVLSRCLAMLANNGGLCLISLCRGVVIPFHVLYVDEIMIFSKGSKKNIHSVLRIFKDYGDVS